jgi:hypothetical protein
MSDEPNYKERYCAFVDVLGFRQLLSDLDKGRITIEQIRDLLRFTHESHHDRLYPGFGFYGADVRHQSISDAVCISALPTPAGLMHIFNALQTLSLTLLRQGFFTRGALVKGPLYHDERIVFGDALVKAYLLEQSIVRFPRIMLTRDVALDAEKHLSHEIVGSEFSNRIGRASDGPHFLHVLRAVMALHDEDLDDKTRQTLVAGFNETADKIQTRFDESADNPSHFEKVRWFADYWNDSISTLPELKRIFGPGLTLPPLPLGPQIGP